jgi:hypothetical protein
MTESGCPPDITICWAPHESNTVHMAVPPDKFISQLGQRCKWSRESGDLAQDSRSTLKASRLWSANETRTVHVHPMVSLVNFLTSSGIRVIERTLRVLYPVGSTMERTLCTILAKV